MASEWYLINKPTYNGGFEGEEFNAYKNDGLEEILGEDSPISSSVSLINADLSEILNFRAVVQNNTSDSKTNTTDRQVITNIGTLKCGDYLLYDGNVYMVISFVGNNTIYEKAIVGICNYTLKFQYPQIGTILSYPCIDASNSTVGIDESNTISTLNRIHTIKVPFDDNTKLIGVDDRFFLDKVGTTTYKVTNVNNTEFNYGDKGLIELTMQQDVMQINDGDLPKDRQDLGICNYFEPSVEPKLPVEGEFSMIISTSGDLYVGFTNPRTFIATLVDSSNTPIPFVPVWTFDYNGISESDFTITYVDNQCKIKVMNNYDILGSFLRVICTTDDGLYSTSYDALITI